MAREMQWVEYQPGIHYSGLPPSPRSGHSALLVGSSKLVVYGGLSERKFLGDVCVLDLKEGRWLSPDCGEGPIPRAFHSAVCLEGNVFIFGGRSGKRRLNDLWMLDTENWKWWELPCGGDVPCPRDFAAFAAAGSGRLVLHGGWDSTKFLSDTFILDTLTLTWRAVAAGGALMLPAARCGHSVAVVEKRLIIFGGRGTGGGMLGDLWALKGVLEEDDERTAWTVLRLPGAAPSPRCGHSCTASGTQLLFFGGHGQEGWITRTDVYLNNCTVLDRTSVQWRPLATSGLPPSKRAYHTMTAVGKRFLLIGGFDGKTTFSDLWWLCGADDEWAQQTRPVAPAAPALSKQLMLPSVAQMAAPAEGEAAMAELRQRVGLEGLSRAADASTAGSRAESSSSALENEMPRAGDSSLPAVAATTPSPSSAPSTEQSLLAMGHRLLSSSSAAAAASTATDSAPSASPATLPPSNVGTSGSRALPLELAAGLRRGETHLPLLLNVPADAAPVKRKRGRPRKNQAALAAAPSTLHAPPLATQTSNGAALGEDLLFFAANAASAGLSTSAAAVAAAVTAAHTPADQLPSPGRMETVGRSAGGHGYVNCASGVGMNTKSKRPRILAEIVRRVELPAAVVRTPKRGESSRDLAGGKKAKAKYVDWIGEGHFPEIHKAVLRYDSITTAIRFLQATFKIPGSDESIFDRLSFSTVKGWYQGGTREIKASIKAALCAAKSSTKRSQGWHGVPSFFSLYPEMQQIFLDHFSKLRKEGAVLNSTFMKTHIINLVTQHHPEALKENGGKFSFSGSWIRLWRRDVLRWKLRSAEKNLPPDWSKQVHLMLLRMAYLVFTFGIPPSLVVNVDQIGMLLAPEGHQIDRIKDERVMALVGLGDKRQLHAVVASAADGTLLPLQVAFEGDTRRVIPKTAVASRVREEFGWQLSHTESHWSNERTMKEWVEGVLLPYYSKVLQENSFASDQKMILVVDCWAVHKSSEFRELLKQTCPNLVLVFIPSGTSFKVQPAEIVLHRPLKSAYEEEFLKWVEKNLQLQKQQEQHVCDQPEPQQQQWPPLPPPQQQQQQQQQHGGAVSSAILSSDLGVGQHACLAGPQKKWRALPKMNLTAPNLRGMAPGWLLMAWTQIRDNIELVKRGWEKSGCLDAWKGEVQMEAFQEDFANRLFDDEYGYGMEDEPIVATPAEEGDAGQAVRVIMQKCVGDLTDEMEREEEEDEEGA